MKKVIARCLAVLFIILGAFQSHAGEGDHVLLITIDDRKDWIG